MNVGRTIPSCPTFGRTFSAKKINTMKAQAAITGKNARATGRGADQVASPLNHHCIGIRLTPLRRAFASNAKPQRTKLKRMAIPTMAMCNSPRKSRITHDAASAKRALAAQPLPVAITTTRMAQTGEFRSVHFDCNKAIRSRFGHMCRSIAGQNGIVSWRKPLMLPPPGSLMTNGADKALPSAVGFTPV